MPESVCAVPLLPMGPPRPILLLRGDILKGNVKNLQEHLQVPSNEVRSLVESKQELEFTINMEKILQNNINQRAGKLGVSENRFIHDGPKTADRLSRIGDHEGVTNL